MANITFKQNLLPKTDNTYTLGNSDYKWNIYANTINGTAIDQLGLPAVDSTNNGQILQVDDGEWTVGDAPSGLPAVTNSDNGKVLLVNSGAWAATTLTIPTKVSDLTNDAGYLTAHQDISGKANTADLATVATSGSYVDLLNKPDLSVYLTSVPTMTGATSSAAGTAGLIPAPASADREKFFRGDGTWQDGGKPMVILSYGNSTWNDFITAYNNKVIVYCRASSNANPATGSQTRMAFMAYVNNADNPTNVEFQYYRSVNPTQKSASQMSDQVFVYTLTSAGAWSVTTRQAGIQSIAAASGSKIGVSYSNSAVTLSNTMTANDMPMSSSDATTAKAAIDSLNSKVANKADVNTPTNDANTFADGITVVTASSGISNLPTNDRYSIYSWTVLNSPLRRVQFAQGLTAAYIRSYAGSWGDWQELALNSKMPYVLTKTITNNNVHNESFVVSNAQQKSYIAKLVGSNGWSYDTLIPYGIFTNDVSVYCPEGFSGGTLSLFVFPRS